MIAAGGALQLKASRSICMAEHKWELINWQQLLIRGSGALMMSSMLHSLRLTKSQRLLQK